MHAIVFDLELIKRFKKGQVSQIVEIGACKVSLETKEITDQLQIYITPKEGYVSKSTRKFIHMTKEDVKNAVSFPIAINQFVHWLGNDYYLCAWGKDDKAHIMNQCIRLKIKLDWLKNYNDIQKPIGKLLLENNKSPIGLKNALDLAGIELQGKAHRGIDDALNTAHLFVKYIDQIDLQENEVSRKEITKQYKNIKNISQQPKSTLKKKATKNQT